MKSGKLAALLCLIVTLWPRPCAATLLPGDIALTRLQGNTVALMALRPIPAGEVIEFTNDFWVNGAFDGSGGSGSITLATALQPGEQQLIDLSASGISLAWKDTLHFYQTFTPPFTTQSHIRHLLLIELSQDGLRWRTNIPDGLIKDVTHIVIGELFVGQGLNHVMREDLLEVGLTPYKWLSVLGSFRAWSAPEDYLTPITLSQWSTLQLTVNPSAGMISLPFKAQNYSEGNGQIHVPIRRSFGSSGNASVAISVSDKVAAFRRWKNETISGRDMDLTDVAFGPGIGFVAISPKSGVILINDGSSWAAYDTNNNPGENLLLSGITHDGSDFWACSVDGRIYKSGDGKNWSWVYTVDQIGAKFLRMHYLPGATFPYIAVGRSGLCAYSANGTAWSLAPTGSSADLFGASYFGGNYLLCGSGGEILYINHPAEAWLTASTPDTRTLYSIAKVDFGGTPTLLAVGEHGQMVQTTNPGNGFISIPSNTTQSLFDVIETTRNSGADKYILAVGAGGAAVVAENSSPFTTLRLDRRAPALYALAQYGGGAEPEVFAVGEYGSLIRFIPPGNDLSGSITGIDLNSSGSTLALNWESGVSSEQYITLSNSAALAVFRERITVQLKKPVSPGSPYFLGNDESEINFFHAPSAGAPPVADNFGPLLNLTDVQLQVVSSDEWTLSFRILNTSRRSSKDLFLRFEGTNLPDFPIPDAATVFSGSRIGPLEHSGLIQIPLRQPVESIGLYEEFRTGEEVLKTEVAINCLAANTSWEPNELFPRSLGAYLNDETGLIDPGLPGLGILNLGGGSGPAPAPAPEEAPKKPAEDPPIAYAGGFVFSGSAPTPPDNNPESSELVLLSVDIGGPIGMDVRDSYDFFLVGTFYNTGTGLNEDYTMNTVDWEVTEASSPAVGLSILDDVGTFEATAYPGVQYTRSVSIDAVTTEGAPLDGEGNPVEYTDSQALDINEPASYRTYAEWVATNGLAGDEDGEEQDPDGDGIVNLLEYVLDTDPNVSNSPSGTSDNYDPDTGELTFCFTIPNDLSEVTLKIETSTDLSNWTQQEMTLDSSDSFTETWCATVTLGDTGFARLRAETYTP